MVYFLPLILILSLYTNMYIYINMCYMNFFLPSFKFSKFMAHLLFPYFLTILNVERGTIYSYVVS